MSMVILVASQKLLPNKIVLTREHLGIALADMACKLEVSPGRVSNYGRSEPTLMEMLVYARLGKVHWSQS